MKSPDEFAFDRGVVDEKTIEIARLKLGEAFEGVLEILDKYMDMPEQYRKLVAVWIIGTYFHQSFNSYPYLFLNAMRGSGKTRLLKIISHLSYNGFGRVQSGITESVLFRMPSGNTLVLDELEQIGSKDKQALREYMNASYKRGGVVGRSKKAKIDGREEWITDYFEPYKPIAMANIWGMDEVLGDRCISFVLEKSNNIAKTKLIEDFEINPNFKELKELLKKVSVVCAMSLPPGKTITAWNEYIFSKYNGITTLYTLTTQTTLNDTTQENVLEREEMFEMFNKIDELGIDGRNLELLLPLLFVSKMISIDVFEDMLKIGKDVMAHKKEDEFADSVDVSLYEYVSKQDSEIGYKPLKEVLHGFRTWLGTDDDWINEKWIGRALKRLNLLIDKRRMASGRQVILNVSKAQEKLKIFRGEDGQTD